jgi:glycine cleavage system H protein
MEFPSDLMYTKDHEWVRMEGNTAVVGVTAFAARELGDVVYVEIETQGDTLEKHDVFGTVEAVKTVSDLFLPLSGSIKDVNAALQDQPELVNTDPYGKGWMIKMSISADIDTSDLMTADEYIKMVGM